MLAGKASWEDPAAIDYASVVHDLDEKVSGLGPNDVVFVEGCALVDHPELMQRIKALVVLEITREEARRRRETRVWRPDAVDGAY